MKQVVLWKDQDPWTPFKSNLLLAQNPPRDKQYVCNCLSMEKKMMFTCQQHMQPPYKDLSSHKPYVKHKWCIFDCFQELKQHIQQKITTWDCSEGCLLFVLSKHFSKQHNSLEKLNIQRYKNSHHTISNCINIIQSPREFNTQFKVRAVVNSMSIILS